MEAKIITVDPAHIVSLLRNTSWVITMQWATLIKTEIFGTSDTTELAIITMFFVILLVVVDPILRRLFVKYISVDNTIQCKSIFQFMDFVLSIGFYLFVLFIYEIMIDDFHSSALNILESIVAVFLFTGITAYYMILFEELSKPYQSNRSNKDI